MSNINELIWDQRGLLLFGGGRLSWEKEKNVVVTRPEFDSSSCVNCVKSIT